MEDEKETMVRRKTEKGRDEKEKRKLSGNYEWELGFIHWDSSSTPDQEDWTNKSYDAYKRDTEDIKYSKEKLEQYLHKNWPSEGGYLILCKNIQRRFYCSHFTISVVH